MVRKQRIVGKPQSPPPGADTWVSSGGKDPEIQPSPPPQELPPPPPKDKGKAFPHRVSFDTDSDQYKRLKRAGFESDRALTDIVREAVEHWLHSNGY
jgi:hypothetical protein